MWFVALINFAGWFSFVFTASSAVAGAWSLTFRRPLWNDLIAPRGSWLRWLVWALSAFVVCVFLGVAMGALWWAGVLTGLALHAGMLWLNIAAVRRHLSSGEQVP